MWNNSEIENPRKRKKDVRNRSEYQSEVIKQALVKDTEYVNYAGQTVPAIITGQCCICKNVCFSKVNEFEQVHILDRFNGFTIRRAS